MILRTKQGWLGDWKTRVGGVVAKKTHPIDFIEQCGDKLHGGHAALLSAEGGPAMRMEEAYDDCKPKKLVLLVCKALCMLCSV